MDKILDGKLEGQTGSVIASKKNSFVINKVVISNEEKYDYCGSTVIRTALSRKDQDRVMYVDLGDKKHLIRAIAKDLSGRDASLVADFCASSNQANDIINAVFGCEVDGPAGCSNKMRITPKGRFITETQIADRIKLATGGKLSVMRTLHTLLITQMLTDLGMVYSDTRPFSAMERPDLIPTFKSFTVNLIEVKLRETVLPAFVSHTKDVIEKVGDIHLSILSQVYTKILAEISIILVDIKDTTKYVDDALFLAGTVITNNSGSESARLSDELIAPLRHHQVIELIKSDAVLMGWVVDRMNSKKPFNCLDWKYEERLNQLMTSITASDYYLRSIDLFKTLASRRVIKSEENCSSGIVVIEANSNETAEPLVLNVFNVEAYNTYRANPTDADTLDNQVPDTLFKVKKSNSQSAELQSISTNLTKSLDTKRYLDIVLKTLTKTKGFTLIRVGLNDIEYKLYTLACNPKLNFSINSNSEDIFSLDMVYEVDTRDAILRPLNIIPTLYTENMHIIHILASKENDPTVYDLDQKIVPYPDEFDNRVFAVARINMLSNIKTKNVSYKFKLVYGKKKIEIDATIDEIIGLCASHRHGYLYDHKVIKPREQQVVKSLELLMRIYTNREIEGMINGEDMDRLKEYIAVAVASDIRDVVGSKNNLKLLDFLMHRIREKAGNSSLIVDRYAEAKIKASIGLELLYIQLLAIYGMKESEVNVIRKFINDLKIERYLPIDFGIEV